MKTNDVIDACAHIVDYQFKQTFDKEALSEEEVNRLKELRFAILTELLGARRSEDEVVAGQMDIYEILGE